MFQIAENKTHIEILKQGVEVWNKWREENPDIRPGLEKADLESADLSEANFSRADLFNADLTEANLSRANLNGANLFKANVRRADLRNADLTHAYLHDANFSDANLSKASLSGAHLLNTQFWNTLIKGADLSNAYIRLANFQRANLAGADLSNSDLRDVTFSEVVFRDVDFTDSDFGSTVLCDVDLSNVKGLETVQHLGPSSIGIDTIYKSRGQIPEVFLRGAGVPEIFIEYMHSLVNENPIQFYSCFISYGDCDRPFVDRLYADLQAKGIRTWYWQEDHTVGAKTWREIDTKINLYDKLVVVCSKEALSREPVIKEIERALGRETSEGTEILFPIMIDNYIIDEWDHYLKPELTNRNIGDFRDWDKDPSKYQETLKRLMKGLGKKDID